MNGSCLYRRQEPSSKSSGHVRTGRSYDVLGLVLVDEAANIDNDDDA